MSTFVGVTVIFVYLVQLSRRFKETLISTTEKGIRLMSIEFVEVARDIFYKEVAYSKEDIEQALEGLQEE